jgi:hypothetical protein
MKGLFDTVLFSTAGTLEAGEIVVNLLLRVSQIPIKKTDVVACA